MVDYKDWVSCGMAAVLRAYHIEQGFDVIPNLRVLTPEDITRAEGRVKEVLPKRNEGHISIIDTLLKQPVIPEQNVNLNQIVSKLGRVSFGVDRYTKMGAVSMYMILYDNWQKLSPPKPSSNGS